ncbi:unnamed protein product [Trichogramma brassicae]|uniref:Uncharacterized protein n=1 Tax=Trichogramma brassicae TaxID=86971 RepID=A0A6H5J3X9_9HYME|nr:unnamed protein product [Trichogramma brassicae]
MVNIFRAHYNLEKFKRDPQRLNPNKRTNRGVLKFNPAGVSSLAAWRLALWFSSICRVLLPPACARQIYEPCRGLISNGIKGGRCMNNCFVYQNVASIFCARKRVLLYNRNYILFLFNTYLLLISFRIHNNLLYT